jgi:hypothetical protein
MAYLNTRGTLTRSRLDFYETSNCWGFVSGSLGTGSLGAYLLNNATTNLQLDIYGVRWFSSTPEVWSVSLVQPVQTISPVMPDETFIHCMQPDLPAPVGLVGLANALDPLVYYRMLLTQNPATEGEIELGYGTPHAVLPPGWIMLVSTTATGNYKMSATFFFQQVLDNVPPAQ